MAGIKLTKLEKSWVLYDVGNSAFVLLASAIVPIYFASLAEGNAMVAWGYAETVASLVVALLMPILGSFADFKGNKMKFFIGFFATGALGCLCLGFPVHWLAFLVVYVIAAIGLNSSMVFYDAMIVDVTDDERIDEVSSHGFAWGYIGSTLPFILCIVIVLFGDKVGLSTGLAMKIAFALTALWWVVFTLPLIRDVKQVHYKEHVDHAIRDTFSRLSGTVKKIAGDKAILFFMLSFFFYIDGVHTIIKMATSYGNSLGIDSTQLILALLVTQFVAFPSAIVYGRISSKVGTKRMLAVSIVAYAFITIFAAFFLRTAAEFWVLAVAVGLFQGGIQALSRSYFGRLVPRENVNEFYGFFDIFGKYAAVLGTALVSITTQITGNGSMGVLSIGILFVVGFILLLKVPENHADRPRG